MDTRPSVHLHGEEQGKVWEARHKLQCAKEKVVCRNKLPITLIGKVGFLKMVILPQTALLHAELAICHTQPVLHASEFNAK